MRKQSCESDPPKRTRPSLKDQGSFWLYEKEKRAVKMIDPMTGAIQQPKAFNSIHQVGKVNTNVKSA